MKSCVVLLVVLLLSGCMMLEHQQGSDMLFDEVIVSNQTSAQITDFKLVDLVTHGFFGCSVIIPGKTCSVAFGKRYGEGHEAELRWSADGIRYREPFAISYIEPGETVKKIYVYIRESGQLMIEIR